MIVQGQVVLTMLSIRWLNALIVPGPLHRTASLYPLARQDNLPLPPRRIIAVLYKIKRAGASSAPYIHPLEATYLILFVPVQSVK
jgi:hypothetical protein